MYYFYRTFFFPPAPTFHRKCNCYLLVWTVHSSNNSFQPQPTLYNYFSCAVHKKSKKKKKKFIKIIGWIKGNNIIQGPKRFSYEKNACAKVHKHIDIYFRWSGDFWFVSKFLVVVCSRSCHGSGSGISKALLHLIQKVLFVLFIKLLEVCVKESVTNQIPRGRLNINQLLSILFQSHSCICCSHCIHGWEIA